jgi:hypothetical protein
MVLCYHCIREILFCGNIWLWTSVVMLNILDKCNDVLLINPEAFGQ